MESPETVLDASAIEIPVPATAGLGAATETVIPDWQVASGEFWIVGGLPSASPSGVIPTLAGLEKPGAGRVRLFGQDPGDLPEETLVALRRRIGVVFAQGGRLLRNLSVRENIALPLRYHRFMFPDEIEDRVEHFARALDLRQHLGRSAVALSPSAQQRVALARALVLEPELLFLDRPLTVANPDRYGWWLDQLLALRQGIAGLKPMTIVAGTDSLHVWRGMPGRFAVIDGGRWQVLGSTEEARDHSALAAPDWTRQKREG